MAAAGFDAPSRRAFLADCPRDLDAGLRERGGRLVVRSGDVLAGGCVPGGRRGGHRRGALAADVSAFAHRRERRLRRALEAEGRRLPVHDTVTWAVTPGTVTPSSSDQFAVFTPYFRHWSRHRPRDPLTAPGSSGCRTGPVPSASPDCGGVRAVAGAGRRRRAVRHAPGIPSGPWASGAPETPVPPEVIHAAPGRRPAAGLRSGQ
ncbi:deoxyribodipyrimidine photo-lyase [Streptomyces sp.]|uniref:deoxyribodipyrimidine photo-lyase n=1 Tax=Streptomyces sp. TaxID=1931 RepID=UPI002D712D20|nr:deoxyribodipyrimidine photo-lyase [Streptomyces sp.]HZF92370.1 deoxyribodipyrimidine photo-lyase [Streptomyces sp.]